MEMRGHEAAGNLFSHGTSIVVINFSHKPNEGGGREGPVGGGACHELTFEDRVRRMNATALHTILRLIKG